MPNCNGEIWLQTVNTFHSQLESSARLRLGRDDKSSVTTNYLYSWDDLLRRSEDIKSRTVLTQIIERVGPVKNENGQEKDGSDVGKGQDAGGAAARYDH